MTWTTAPLLTVPSEQLNEVPPPAPVQVDCVVVPLTRLTEGVPVSTMLAGRLSDTTTLSASASPAPTLFCTTIV